MVKNSIHSSRAAVLLHISSRQLISMCHIPEALCSCHSVEGTRTYSVLTQESLSTRSLHVTSAFASFCSINIGVGPVSDHSCARDSAWSSTPWQPRQHSANTKSACFTVSNTALPDISRASWYIARLGSLRALGLITCNVASQLTGLSHAKEAARQRFRATTSAPFF